MYYSDVYECHTLLVTRDDLQRLIERVRNSRVGAFDIVPSKITETPGTMGVTAVTLTEEDLSPFNNLPASTAKALQLTKDQVITMLANQIEDIEKQLSNKGAYLEAKPQPTS